MRSARQSLYARAWDGWKMTIIAKRSLIGLLLISIVCFPISAWTTLSVSLSTITFECGTRPANTWLTPQTTVVRNDGDVAENLAAKLSQLAAGGNTWTLSSTVNGADSICAQWSITSVSGPWTDLSAYDSDFTIDTNVAVNDSVTFWFQIQTPKTTTAYDPYSATLTITATLH